MVRRSLRFKGASEDPSDDDPKRMVRRRMVRRSLRLKGASEDPSDDDPSISTGANISFHRSSSKDRSLNRSTRQKRNTGSQSTVGSYHATGRGILNSSLSQTSVTTSNASDTPVLDESLIREHTEVGHLWGKAASGLFCWLGTGWSQFTTLITFLNVFFLTRCHPKICRFFLLLTPLLLLLSLWFWGFEVWFALFPALKVKGTSSYAPCTAKVPNPALAPESDVLTAPGEKGMNFLFDAHRISEIEKHHAAIVAEQIVKSMNFLFDAHRISEIEKHLAAIAAEQSRQKEENKKMMVAIAAEQSRQKEENEKMMVAIAAEQSRQKEENEKMILKIQEQVVQTIAAEQSRQKEEYEKMILKIQEQVVQTIAAVQSRQKEEYEKMILKIQEQVVQLSDRSQEACVIVNNALKLYSEDKTGMVDFALESAGGCILKMRCSETYQTKTSFVLRIFRFQIWSFSNSPRVVIQPSMYPGNCWAMKGSRGFFAVRLSMRIYPTAFSIEHIPKALSKTGRIASAPKDFAVYGLEDEYQQEGTLLLRDVYDESGEPLQIFHVMEKNQKSFPIVELQIFSNWGHTDYTCLYRFRAHGTPVKRTLYLSPP